MKFRLVLLGWMLCRCLLGFVFSFRLRVGWWVFLLCSFRLFCCW